MSVLGKVGVVVVGVAAVGYLTGGGLDGAGAAAPAGHDPAVIKVVYQVGRAHGASDKVMLAAFEACVVETGCRNLSHGDRDSLGVFQQRPSQGWGSAAQVTDVRYAARQFFLRAIAAERCCPTSGLLAQHVQRSCCPHKYDQHRAQARALMTQAQQLST